MSRWPYAGPRQASADNPRRDTLPGLAREHPDRETIRMFLGTKDVPRERRSSMADEHKSTSGELPRWIQGLIAQLHEFPERREGLTDFVHSPPRLSSLSPIPSQSSLRTRPAPGALSAAQL